MQGEVHLLIVLFESHRTFSSMWFGRKGSRESSSARILFSAVFFWLLVICNRFQFYHDKA